MAEGVMARIVFFEEPGAWRRWLERHHGQARELWVGFRKRASGRPSVTWPQAVDEALCFGWIDGIRKSIDETSYKIRFTPRQPGSNWSQVNIKRVRELSRRGLIRPPGRAAFEGRRRDKTPYSYEQRHSIQLAPGYARQLRASKRASAFLQKRPPWYRRLVVFWVMSAKQEATRQRRLDRLIADSAKGQLIGPLARPVK
jgi:uncharacterized protein YdeI (YjbR/CyaY-like superfamily)